MRKKKHSIFFCCSMMVLISFILFAHVERKGKVNGKIVDTATGQPINASVHVFIQNAKIGAGSNLDGEYSIVNIPPGKYDIKFSSLEYGTQTIEDVTVNFAQTTRLNVSLDKKMEYKEIAALSESEKVQ